MRQMIVASALCDSIDSPPANGSNAGKAREKPRLELHSFDKMHTSQRKLQRHRGHSPLTGLLPASACKGRLPRKLSASCRVQGSLPVRIM